MKQNAYTGMEVYLPDSLVLYIKTVTSKNDASSKITNFQKDMYFKEHSWRWRLSILFSIVSITVSVISHSHIWNKILKSVWQHIRTFFKKIAIVYFWTTWPNSFHNVIFINQWGHFSPVSIKILSEDPSLHHSLLCHI